MARPEFTMPTRKTVQRDIIDKLYPTYKRELKKMLQKEMVCDAGFHFTTDLWTCGVQSKGYMVVTIHFISSSWKMVHFILSFQELEIPHSGENIAKAFYAVTRDYGIHEHLVTISLDNASSNTTAVSILKGKYSKDLTTDDSTAPIAAFEGNWKPLKNKLGWTAFHGRCQCHILNLMSQSGLTTVDESLKNLRAIIKHIQTPKQAKIFEARVKEDANYEKV